MSRITAPVSKQLTRALNSAATARPVGPLLDHNAGAVLMPKYADLLHNRSINEHTDSSRGLTTTHRPTPQPSIANRSKPLMQTFSSSASSRTPSSNLDATILPSREALYGSGSSYSSTSPSVPILPDNYSHTIAESAEESSDAAHEVTIIAADPDKVSPGSAMAEVGDIGLDGVDFKFAHEGRGSSGDDQAHQGGMLRDLWKGMLDDVLGEPAKKAA